MGIKYRLWTIPIQVEQTNAKFVKQILIEAFLICNFNQIFVSHWLLINFSDITFSF